MWAVYNLEEEGLGIHVVPCDEKGTPLTSHIPSSECPCHPEVEDIIIHNELH